MLDKGQPTAKIHPEAFREIADVPAQRARLMVKGRK
jgi:hypothetical protein